MATRIRAHDWSRSSLGAIGQWSPSLRHSVSFLLSSKAQIVLFWGPDLVVLYNDAYRPVFGTKHPWALGRTAPEAWSEVWDFLGPVFTEIVRTGDAYAAKARPFYLERYGFREETYFDVSYDPVWDELGQVAGIYCIVSDVTGTVLGERRLATLRELGTPTAGRGVTEVAVQAIATLARTPADVPYAVLYLREPGGRARAVAQYGVSLRPEAGEVGLDTIGAAGTVDPGAFVTDVPSAGRRDLAALVPLTSGTTLQGSLLAGVSRHLAYEGGYVDFFSLVGSAIGAALLDADAFEEERRRAKALAELDRAKTTFFSNVSHEFRTPLTLMLGPTEDALASPGRALSGEALEILYRNELRLLKLVNALLEFSRIEAGRMQASYTATDLSQYTLELASMFRSAVERAGLELVLRCDRLSEPVYVDRAMWENIVLNLLSNAVKFTFAGRIDVSLRETGAHVELRVSDTGCGIAAEHLPHLFDRFHRIEGVKARTHEGSGIGLALVGDLIRLHGGTIAVESRVGHGTTFLVCVPRGVEHLPADRIRSEEGAIEVTGRGTAFLQEALRWLPAEGSAATAETAGSAPEGDPRRHRPPEPGRSSAHILVVDDNADMRDYLARLLRQHWSVDTAPDGTAALAAVHRQRPDVVLTDVMMPGPDGLELLRALRGDPRTSDIPVLVLSARAGEEARIEGLRRGADDYLTKPFSARELIARITGQLALAEGRRLALLERDRLRDLLSQIPAMVNFLEGPDLVFELAHPLTIQALGGRDIRGKPLLEAIPEHRGQPFVEMLQRVYATGEPCTGRERLARLDRSNTGEMEDSYWNFTYLPVRSSSGDIEGVMTFEIEVTDQVRARRLLEEQAAALAEAQRIAESASRAKDEFLAMLGHELRNPLAPILTALQLMRLRAQASRELDIIERQVAHLARLVDDLLDVTRITRGTIDLNPRPVEISKVVGRAMELASPLLEQRQHGIEIDVPRTGLTVNADPDRLAQVVTNLLTNAAKYSDAGSRIVVSARSDGASVRLSVRDEGAGIAPDMLATVFEPFVQQPQTLDRSRGGLGLGLTIVRSLAEMHGGTVHVESDGVGRGSEFIVRLPAIDARDEPDGVPGIAAPPLARREAAGRVLVVDDNVDAADMLKQALEALGFIVDVAHDGPSALERSRASEPDIALLDIGLPVIDGYELAHRLHAERPRLRLIAVTGYGRDCDREQSARAGFDEHLVKPIDLSRLEDVLTRARARLDPLETPRAP